MSMPQEHFFETALSLPQSERADLAFQLLQSLDHPGDEVPAEQFGDELQARIDAYRRGDLEGLSVEETRAIVQRRLAEGPPK
jgi:putative addiction module component (TIGR02574 family)